MNEQDLQELRSLAAAINQILDRAERASPPPAPAPRPHTPARPAPATNDARCPFGKNKGELLEQLSDADLRWLRDALQRSVDDPEKAQYRAKNERDLRNVLAELDRRFVR